MSETKILPQISTSNWNVPNALTMTRIMLSLVMFGFLECECYIIGLILFVIASVTDWIDGWWARKYHQVTVFGRIMDPFADKLVVCGAFIYLASLPELVKEIYGLRIIVVIIVARELFITTLRAFLEQQGRDFSAKMAGKLKMWLQCVAIPACLLWVILPHDMSKNLLPQPLWLYWLMILSVWGTLIITIYSGVGYVIAALKK
ncbi:MAG: CDP-diacylglycerol--glycerol-3-phosphate 3-phosphatidyltransferase [Planctomycetaceae bacterium]|jgi:CDP-diacylglycerol--glycerol-3-phosphate 3-phosphatidyltransferase|nr:CDP-diacylglycerol--glycerol-3-phosphate 3-phosphatidyltransferase [Planctomycetaceae bacterium]